MKYISRWIDRFCARHPGFGVTNLMMYLVIGNAVVWLFALMNRSFLYFLYFMPSEILRGQIWRLVTFALIPARTDFLEIICLIFYFFVGRTLEAQWGTVKFNLYFICGVFLTVIFGFIVYFTSGIELLVGADYIYYSLFFAFATLFPEQRVLLFYIIPIKVKWIAFLEGALFLWEIATGSWPVCLLPLIAMLNYLLFCGDLLLGSVNPSFVKSRTKTINFRREAEKVRAEQASAPYRFKCSVCGRTDTDNPGLDFRYCSRCSGYHCFCVDHINNHIHFTE